MICSVCKEEKDLTNFYLTKDKKHYHNKCKKCYIGYTCKIQFTRKHRDALNNIIYEKYMSELNKCNNLQEKYLVKSNLYKEDISETIKDQIWEKIYDWQCRKNNNLVANSK
jgi:hypothetical protein